MAYSAAMNRLRRLGCLCALAVLASACPKQPPAIEPDPGPADAGVLLKCAAGLVICNDKCVDLKADAQNCSACGQACGPNTICLEAMCLSSCPLGTQLCSSQC